MAIPSLSVLCYYFQELCETTYQTTCTLVCVAIYGGTSQGFLASVLELGCPTTGFGGPETPGFASVSSPVGCDDAQGSLFSHKNHKVDMAVCQHIQGVDVGSPCFFRHVVR